jgi:hypothetical protein
MIDEQERNKNKVDVKVLINKQGIPETVIGENAKKVDVNVIQDLSL